MTSLVVRILQELIAEVQNRETDEPVEDVDSVLSELNDDMDPRDTREILLSLEADVASLHSKIDWLDTMVRTIGQNVQDMGTRLLEDFPAQAAPVMNVNVNDNTNPKDIAEKINAYFEEKATRSVAKDSLTKRRPHNGFGYDYKD